MRLIFALLFCLAAVALPARPGAQPRLTFSGSATVALSSDAPSPAIGLLDVTADIRLSHALHLEIGALEYVLRGKHPHETYAALAWNDRWRLGVIRPAYDGVLSSALVAMAPHAAFDARATHLSYATVGAMSRTDVPWGLSYSAQGANLRWGVSLHDTLRGGYRMLSGALAWSRGGWTLSAAAEGVWSSAGTWRGANLKAAAALSLPQTEVALTLFHPDANRAPDAAELSLTRHLRPRLDLGVVAHVEQGRSGDLAGLGLSYALGGASRVFATALGGTSNGSLQLGLEARF